jgi:hypothetical protein
MNKIYYVVCSHEFRSQLQKIEEYKMDLGKSFSNKGERVGTTTVNIEDHFVIKFFNENKSLLYKVGVLGAINFYTTPKIDINTIIISDIDRSLTHDISFDDYVLVDTDIKLFLGKLIHEFENIS